MKHDVVQNLPKTGPKKQAKFLAMGSFALCLLALLLLCTPVSLAQGLCYPDYECAWSTYAVDGALYEFDFSHLCSSYGDTVASDPPGYTYSFNLCGTSPKYCLPKGNAQTFSRGTMIQFQEPSTPAPEDCVRGGAAARDGVALRHLSPPFFTPPLPPPSFLQADDRISPGNTSSCDCTDPYDNSTRVCTAPCEVLGVGLPVWSLLDPTNPATGGVQLTYTGLSEGLYACPTDPATGRPFLRTITYSIACDPSVGTDEFETDGVTEEGSNCQYKLAVRTGAACGCAPDCVGKTCGSDGCGGFCSGPLLYGVCPNGQACQSGVCCRRDCGQDGASSKRDCGSDGCGGSCGTCGEGQFCATSHTCVSTAGSIPDTAPVEWVEDSGGLFGAWLGGVVVFAAVAGAVWLHTTAGAEFLSKAREVGLRAAVTAAVTGGNAYQRVDAGATAGLAPEAMKKSSYGT